MDTGPRSSLSTPRSDIDLVIFGLSVESPLYALAAALEEDGIASGTKVLDKARVPIVKFMERRTSVAVDISLNLASGLESAALIQGFMHQFPVRPRHRYGVRVRRTCC